MSSRFAMPRRSARNLFAFLMATVSVTVLTPAGAQVALAQERAVSVRYSIPAGPLPQALNRFADVSGLQLVYDAAATRTLRTGGFSGQGTASGVLSTLLSGTGLTWRSTGSNSVTIENPSSASAGTFSADGSTVLDTITVQGQGGTTEGTGSYAAQTATMIKGSSSLKDVPQSVTVLTRKLLDDQQVTTLTEAMQRAPGITTNRETNGYETFYSRGFRIDNYQFDGIGAVYALDPRPNFDMAIYDRVEILRGSEGLFSGTGEPGGSLNLARKRPTSEWQTKGEVSTGSWQNKRVDLDTGGPLAFDGRLRGRFVAAYQDREFFYSPADEQKAVLYGVLEADVTESTTLTAGISHQRRKGNTWFVGLPAYLDGTLDFDRGTALNTDWSYRDEKVTEYFGSVKQELGDNWTLNIGASHQKYYEELTAFGLYGPVSSTGYPVEAATNYLEAGNTSTSVDVNLTGDIDFLGRQHKLLIGADWRSSENIDRRFHVETLGYDTDFRLEDFDPSQFPDPTVLGRANAWPETKAVQKGIYGKLQIEATDRLRFIVGGRYGSYDYSSPFESYDVNGNLVSESMSKYSESGIFTPYGGIIYDLTDQWSVYASISEIYKPQGEYLKGPLDNQSALDPITGRNYEIGARGELLDGALKTSVALYRIERTGEATQDLNYPYSPGDFGTTCCYIERGKVVSSGVDIEVNGEIHPGWNIFAGYTYNHNEDKETDAVFHTLTPKHMFRLWTTYNLPEQWDAWTIGGGVRVQSKHANSGTAWFYNADTGWSEENYKIEQSGYAVFDASVQYRFNEKVTLDFVARNIFDKKYYASLGNPRAWNWYGEPRSFQISLKSKF